jgi:hypothetical protein
MNRSNLFALFPAELKMDVLREREVKDSLERQLTEEQKQRGESTKMHYWRAVSRVEPHALNQFPIEGNKHTKKKLIVADDEL